MEDAPQGQGLTRTRKPLNKGRWSKEEVRDFPRRVSDETVLPEMLQVPKAPGTINLGLTIGQVPGASDSVGLKFTGLRGVLELGAGSSHRVFPFVYFYPRNWIKRGKRYPVMFPSATQYNSPRIFDSKRLFDSSNPTLSAWLQTLFLKEERKRYNPSSPSALFCKFPSSFCPAGHEVEATGRRVQREMGPDIAALRGQVGHAMSAEVAEGGQSGASQGPLDEGGERSWRYLLGPSNESRQVVTSKLPGFFFTCAIDTCFGKLPWQL